MANTSPRSADRGTNRFALLAEAPAKKRKANIKNITTEIFPKLPSVTKEDHKYLVVSSVKINKSLSDYSCFAIHKCSNALCKDILNVRKLRDGNLLLLVKNTSVATKLFNTKSLPNICDISVKYHDNLNVTKGTIFAPFLKYIEESEIVNELKDFGVIEAYKFKKNYDGKLLPSGVILFSFNRYNLPSQIDVAGMTVRVKQHIQTNPITIQTSSYSTIASEASTSNPNISPTLHNPIFNLTKNHKINKTNDIQRYITTDYLSSNNINSNSTNNVRIN